MNTPTKRYWLMKTEPTVFSFEDLVKAARQTTAWEGVRNYQARNFMRDEFQKGDRALIYHSNAEPTAIVGIAEVVRAGYPDSTALDRGTRYYDPKAAQKGESPWFMVDVRATARLTQPLTRDLLAKDPVLKDMLVLKKGMRLSIQPVTRAQFERIEKLGKPEKI